MAAVSSASLCGENPVITTIACGSRAATCSADRLAKSLSWSAAMFCPPARVMMPLASPEPPWVISG
ncbi:hypothetical protein Ae505Ps2_6328c [Pseudonocardia sp. Ae505_Ps2]|nr:hypothetical protein Ae505Ps2_6328c [Pseudonocardia sp. Ae505_Ps2]